MSRTPEELLHKLDDKNKWLADQLEGQIDDAMDRSYGGGEFVFHPVDLNYAVVQELERRYSSWKISYSGLQDPYGDMNWTLKFKPKENSSS